MWELLAPLFGKVVDKVFPDPAAAAAAKLKLFELQQSGELAQLTAGTTLATAQIRVDQAEAASADKMEHWRGGLGWVCTFAYGWNFVALPMAEFAAIAAGHPITFPKIDIQPLAALTLGMLGLGTMHVYQTVKTQ